MPASLGEDDRRLYVQAMAGLLWSRQYYHYDVHRWLKGDPAQPTPPAARRSGRNSEWSHHYNSDVLSMPDKWEYPWYAALDLAFHCIPFLNLWEVACELSRRLVATLRRDEHGHRPAMGGDPRWRDDLHFRDLVLFHECFHGDTGQGLDASHQTGWTALVAKLLQQSPLWGEPAHHVRGRVSL
jgi:hypothetical protein